MELFRLSLVSDCFFNLICSLGCNS